MSALPNEDQPPAAPLSQWLQLMLAEIARKREEQERVRDEPAQCEIAGAARAENLPTR